MNKIRTIVLIILILQVMPALAQDFSVISPDNNIVVNINNNKKLTYSVTYKGKSIIDQSPMGFEFKDEQPMTGNFDVVDQKTQTVNEKWIPVVKSKHAEIINNYNELHLFLKEKPAQMRQMELIIRAYNDGAAFQYKLF
jgi:alpha-glucosidase